MLSYDTGQDGSQDDSSKLGNLTLSATRTLLYVLCTHEGSASIGYRLRLPEQTFGKSVIAALRSDIAVKTSHFTLSMGGTGYVMVPIEKNAKAFVIKRLAEGVRLDKDQPQVWAAAKSEEICRIKWSPEADSAFLRETLHYGYEIVFDKSVDLELPVFCLWLLNSICNQRNNGRMYGPLPVDRTCACYRWTSLPI